MKGVAKLYPATVGLIALNLLVFIWTSVQADPYSSKTLIGDGAVYPWFIATKGEWWRLISGIFLHGGVTHILLNMVSLYIVGKIAEELFGSFKYLVIYLVSGIFGGVVSCWIHPDGLSVGASGAIFGVFGAIAGYALMHKDLLGERFKLFMKEFGVVLILNLVIGFSIPGIDMSAHMGGMIVGAIGGYLAYRSRLFWAWVFVALMVGAWYIGAILPGQYSMQGMMY